MFDLRDYCVGFLCSINANKLQYQEFVYSVLVFSTHYLPTSPVYLGINQIFYKLLKNCVICHVIPPQLQAHNVHSVFSGNYNVYLSQTLKMEVVLSEHTDMCCQNET